MVGGGFLGEVDFDVADFIESVFARCLWDLEHLSYEWCIAIGIFGISIINSEGNLATSVCARITFGEEVNAHTTTASWRLDHIYSFIIVIVNLVLWYTEYDSIPQKGSYGKKCEKVYTGFDSEARHQQHHNCIGVDLTRHSKSPEFHPDLHLH